MWGECLVVGRGKGERVQGEGGGQLLWEGEEVGVWEGSREEASVGIYQGEYVGQGA